MPGDCTPGLKARKSWYYNIIIFIQMLQRVVEHNALEAGSHNFKLEYKVNKFLNLVLNIDGGDKW